MKVHEIAETIGISKVRVGYILHKELDMKKLCARWLSYNKCTCYVTHYISEKKNYLIGFWFNKFSHREI
jgi:hypothetical protein